MEPHSKPSKRFKKIPPRPLRAAPEIARFGGVAPLLAALILFAVYAIARAQSGDPTPAPIAAPDSGLPPTVVTTDVTTYLFDVGLVFFLILLNGAFSTAETALVAIRRSRVEQMIEEGQRGARTVQRLLDDPPRFIATVQVGITLLGFSAAAVAATTLAAPLIPYVDWLPGVSTRAAVILSEILVTLVIALFAMVLGEIAPKSMALQAPDFWAMRLAPFVHLCGFLFAPLVALVVWLANLIVTPFGARARFEMPMITKEELEQIIDQGAQQKELDDEEAKILTNVFDLSETMVRTVMTPRTDIAALSADASLDKTLETIIASGHSRIPVYEDTIDNIVGIAHAKDLLPLLKEDRRDMNLRGVLRAPYFIPETKTVSQLLAEMRRLKNPFAVVQDEYAGTAGLVTMEDLVEEIVGEIKDEYDVDEPEVHVLSEKESLIDARMSIADVNERLGLELPDEDYETIGGLVFGLLGHSPEEGERVRQDGIEFAVEQVEGRRIRMVRAIKINSEDAARALAEAPTP